MCSLFLFLSEIPAKRAHIGKTCWTCDSPFFPWNVEIKTSCIRAARSQSAIEWIIIFFLVCSTKQQRKNNWASLCAHIEAEQEHKLGHFSFSYDSIRCRETKRASHRVEITPWGAATMRSDFFVRTRREMLNWLNVVWLINSKRSIQSLDSLFFVHSLNEHNTQKRDEKLDYLAMSVIQNIQHTSSLDTLMWGYQKSMIRRRF